MIDVINQNGASSQSQDRLRAPCISQIDDRFAEAVQPGALHAEWTSADNKANEPVEFDKCVGARVCVLCIIDIDVVISEREALIIAGLKAKHASADIVASRLASIVASRRARQSTARARADELRPLVELDADFARYRRATSLYAAHVAPLVAQYRAVDQLIGRERNRSGALFESASSLGIVDVVCERVGCARRDVAIERGVRWLDARAKPIGEIGISYKYC